MRTIDFLHRTLGTSGHYCIFAVNRETALKTQKFYQRKEDAIEAAQALDRAGSDAYFALATFVDGSSRRAANVHRMKSLYLDLDCGPTKDFPSQRDAVNALRDFCTQLGLPKPMLVDSGRGIHVYWTLTEEVSRDEWLPVAMRLKELCGLHDFPADGDVTADAARVLRLPGTHNYKDDPPRAVSVLAEAANNARSIEEFSELLGTSPIRRPKVHIPAQYNATASLLMTNKTSSFRKILQRGDTGCAQLVYAATNQATVSEPMWRATLSIAAYCSDSEKAIHAVSSGHPDYSPDDTTAKASRIKGPYHCARFDDANPGVCSKCPHNGKITSPIALGRELAVAETEEERTVEVAAPSGVETIVVPTPPFPYLRGANGGVYRRIKDEDGNPDEVLVYHHDIYVVRRVWDVEIGYMVVVRLHLPKDGLREFTLSQQATSSADEIRKALSAQGVTCKTKKQWEAMAMYITDYIEELQTKSVADNAHRQFGWTKDMASFVLGDREYFPNHVGYNPPTPTTARLVPAFESRGTLDEWKELMKFYTLDGMELHQLIICAGFGSPIMAFSAVNALILHLDGPTGFGKTTTQLAMLGIYGCPSDLILDEKDTLNSKMLRLEVMKNLPVAMDELTNHTAEEVGDFVYYTSSGRQKNRMSSGANTERLRGDPWALLVVSSGNASLIGKIEAVKADPDAERERAFEVNISRYVYPHAKDVADKFQTDMKQNVYGVAADPYLRWLVANKDTARKAFLETQARLDAAAGLTSKNRFISAGFAAYLVGGRIAQSLGLIDFNMTKLFKFCVELIKERRDAIEASTKSPTDYLVDYLTEHYNDILRLKSTQDLRSGGDGVGEEFVVPDATPRGRYVARYETDVKRLYLVPKPFKQWCVKQQLNPAAILTDIGELYPTTRVKVRLGRGTKLDIPPTDAYCIAFPLETYVDAKKGDKA